jgi:hypothetical protein
MRVGGIGWALATLATLAACGHASAPPPAAPDPGWRVAAGVRGDACFAEGDACTSTTPAGCDAWIDAGGKRRAHAARVLEEACSAGDRCACARFGRALSYDDARPEQAFRVLDRACREGALPACDDGLLFGAVCAMKDAKPSPLCDVLRAHGRVPPPEPEPPKIEPLPLRPAMRGCFVTSAEGVCPKEPVDYVGPGLDPVPLWVKNRPCGWRVPAGTLLCFDDDAVRERVAPGAFDERTDRAGTGAWDYVPTTWVGTRAGTTRTAQQRGEQPFDLREEKGQVVLESGDWSTPLTRAGAPQGAPTREDLRRVCAHARACIAAIARMHPPALDEAETEAPGQEQRGLLACAEEERTWVRAHGGTVPPECQ